MFLHIQTPSKLSHYKNSKFYAISFITVRAGVFKVLRHLIGYIKLPGHMDKKVKIKSTYNPSPKRGADNLTGLTGGKRFPAGKARLRYTINFFKSIIKFFYSYASGRGRLFNPSEHIGVGTPYSVLVGIAGNIFNKSCNSKSLKNATTLLRHKVLTRINRKNPKNGHKGTKQNCLLIL